MLTLASVPLSLPELFRTPYRYMFCIDGAKSLPLPVQMTGQHKLWPLTKSKTYAAALEHVEPRYDITQTQAQTLALDVARPLAFLLDNDSTACSYACATLGTDPTESRGRQICRRAILSRTASAWPPRTRRATEAWLTTVKHGSTEVLEAALLEEVTLLLQPLAVTWTITWSIAAG